MFVAFLYSLSIYIIGLLNKDCYLILRIDYFTYFSSFLVSGDFYHLLIIFANSLDPDQERQNVGPDLGPNRFDSLIVFLKDFFLKVSRLQQKHEKLPSMQS